MRRCTFARNRRCNEQTVQFVLDAEQRDEQVDATDRTAHGQTEAQDRDTGAGTRREREREKEETPQNKATHKPRGRAAAINLWDVGCSRRWRVGATAAKRCGRLLREETAECIAGRAGLAARQRLAWAASTHPRLSRRAGASSNRRRCPAGVIPLDLAEMIGLLLLGGGGGGDGGALVPGHRTLRRHVAAGRKR